MNSKKIIIIGGDQLSVQEVLDRLWYSDLDIEKVQVVGEGERVGQIHEFKNEPVLVISTEHMAEEGYDLAVMLTKMDNMEKVTSDMVFGSIPFLDMAGAFEPSPDIPMLLPESDGFELETLPMIGILPTGTIHAIASVLNALSDVVSLNSVNAFALNGVSSKGSRVAMDELFEQTRSILGFTDVQTDHFPHQIAFNAFHAETPIPTEQVVSGTLQFAMRNENAIVGLDTAWSSHFVGIIGTIWIEVDTEITTETIIDKLESESGFSVVNSFGGALGVVGKDQIFISDVKMVYNQRKRLTLRFGMDNLRRGLASSLVCLLRAVWVEK